MKPYNRIPIWETKKRLKKLREFHGVVVDYYNNTQSSIAVDGAIENKTSSKLRPLINFTLPTTTKYVHFAGVSTSFRHTPAPAVGGYVQDVDILQNLFNIGQFQVGPNTVTGIIEQAIGVYADDQPASWRRTLNPFWWLGQALSWFAHIPFYIIRQAGFDASKAEGSFVGKLISLLFYLIPIVAGFLAILDRLGFLGALKTLVGLEIQQ